jgi:hypothetical protein
MHQPCIRFVQQTSVAQDIRKQFPDPLPQPVQLKSFRFPHLPKPPSLNKSVNEEGKGNDHQKVDDELGALPGVP